MTVFGYARVGTEEQDLSLQVDALKAAGCTLVRSEKVGGSSRQGRAELAMLLEFSRTGDILVVTRIDRLARSVADLQEIAATLDRKGVGLRVIEQPIDTTTSDGRKFYELLNVIVEFELSIRKEHQREGVARAKARNASKVRPVNDDTSTTSKIENSVTYENIIAESLDVARKDIYKSLQATDLEK